MDTEMKSVPSPPSYYDTPQPVNTGPPPAMPGPPPAQVVHMPTVIVPGVVTTFPAMGAHPQGVTCRSCNMQIVSQVQYKSTTKTHLFALLLCVFGCWPCVCIPYCVNSCKSADHYCPNCEAYIGSYLG